MQPTSLTAPKPAKGWNIALWILQVLLAFAFGMSGFSKLATPLAELAKQYAYVADIPAGLVRFIGVAEVAAALGLLLPALTRIQPRLVVVAALGLVLVMGLAAGFHLSRGEAPMVLPNIMLGALAGLIAWGRAKKAPIYPKS